MTETSIIIIGQHGQLAHELKQQLLACNSSFSVISLSPSDPEHYIDLGKSQSIYTAFENRKVDIIINPAAYTAVDKAEQEPELATAINAEAPRILAEIAAKQNALLIHYSTDYVFDGNKQSPYVETDETVPLNVYGKTKLAGEKAIQDSAARYLIFRTSWVYGLHGNNFLKTMLRLATERDELNIVSDQFGAPTWSHLIAAVTINILQQVLNDTEKQQQLSGLYHLSSGGITNWYEFARAIFQIKGLDGKLTVNAIPTSSYPTPAARPAYSVLDSAKLEECFNIKLPDWHESLQQCLQDS